MAFRHAAQALEQEVINSLGRAFFADFQRG